MMSANSKNRCNVPNQTNLSLMSKHLDPIHTRFQSSLIFDELFKFQYQDNENNSEKEMPSFADPNKTFGSSTALKEHTRGTNLETKSAGPICSSFTIATSIKLVKSKVFESSVIRSQVETSASKVREMTECKFNPENLSPANREQYYRTLQSN